MTVESNTARCVLYRCMKIFDHKFGIALHGAHSFQQSTASKFFINIALIDTRLYLHYFVSMLFYIFFFWHLYSLINNNNPSLSDRQKKSPNPTRVSQKIGGTYHGYFIEPNPVILIINPCH